MTLEERARELEEVLSQEWGAIWNTSPKEIIAAFAVVRREAFEEAADLMLAKAAENDAEAKAAKMPAGSAQHLAANVYRNAEFAIRALVLPADEADRILSRLSVAGYVVVPRVATEVMMAAANALPVTDQVNGWIVDSAMRHGGDTGLPKPPNSPLEQWWGAMVAAGEAEVGAPAPQAAGGAQEARE